MADDVLKTILKNEELSKLLENYITDNGYGTETFYFLKDVAFWQENFHSVSKTARLARAKRIFKSLLTSDELSSDISLKLEDSKNEIQVDLFDQAIIQVSEQIQGAILPKFCQTEEWKQQTDVEIPEVFHTGRRTVVVAPRFSTLLTQPPISSQGKEKVNLQTLKLILQHEVLYQAFEKQLIQELAVESLYFLKDTQEWQRNYYGVGETARLARAKRLFQSFVSPSGSFSINISSVCFDPIFKALQEDGKTNPDMFLPACEEVSELLLHGFLGRFVNSKEYEQVVMPAPTLSSSNSFARFSRLNN